MHENRAIVLPCPERFLGCLLRLCLAAFGAFLLAAWTGCSKAPANNSRALTSMPETTVAAAQNKSVVEVDFPAPPPHAGEPALSSKRSSEVLVAPLSVVALRQRYVSPACDLETRVQIIRELGEVGSVEAVDALWQIFKRDMREELRVEALTAVANMDQEGVNQARFGFITAAVDEKYPRLLRQIAINALSEFEDSRVVPLLTRLHTDFDAQIRALAAETLRDYQR